jgi:hypothetical protein
MDLHGLRASFWLYHALLAVPCLAQRPAAKRVLPALQSWTSACGA